MEIYITTGLWWEGGGGRGRRKKRLGSGGGGWRPREVSAREREEWGGNPRPAAQGSGGLGRGVRNFTASFVMISGVHWPLDKLKLGTNDIRDDSIIFLL